MDEETLSSVLTARSRALTPQPLVTTSAPIYERRRRPAEATGEPLRRPTAGTKDQSVSGFPLRSVIVPGLRLGHKDSDRYQSLTLDCIAFGALNDVVSQRVYPGSGKPAKGFPIIRRKRHLTPPAGGLGDYPSTVVVTRIGFRSTTTGPQFFAKLSYVFHGCRGWLIASSNEAKSEESRNASKSGA